MSAEGRVPVERMTKLLLVMIERQIQTEYGWLFARPVEPKILCKCSPSPCRCGLANYFTIIKSPMDLGTVKQRLREGFYKDVKDCVSDVHLVFNNAMLFNTKESGIPQIAKSMWVHFAGEFKAKHTKCWKEYQEDLKRLGEMKNLEKMKGFVDTFFQNDPLPIQWSAETNAFFDKYISDGLQL
jgi:hypothetical protein